MSRGTGRGRGIPSLSSNFVKGGEMKPYQAKTTQSTPSASTNAVSMNNTVQNSTNTEYMHVKSPGISSHTTYMDYYNRLQNSEPVHNTANFPTQMY